MTKSRTTISASVSLFTLPPSSSSGIAEGSRTMERLNVSKFAKITSALALARKEASSAVARA